MAALLIAGALLGCEREARRFREAPPAATAAASVRVSALQPGTPVRDGEGRSAYEDNAYAVGEGKQLFTLFNCVGCHGNGGGGIGPPLMDGEWIYGSAPENIDATIVQGRPNGMPSFGGRIATAQVWQLVAYVRSLRGLLPKDVAPGRSDGRYVKAPEQATERP